MKKKKICLILAMFIMGIYLVGCTKEEQKDSVLGSKIEYPQLTEFSAETTDNEMINQDILKEYDITLLYFWAPWSEKSVSELKNIASLKKALPDNINVITVILDLEKDGNYSKKIESAKAEKLISLKTGTANLKDLSDCIDKIPTTIIVDGEGTIMSDPIIGIQLNKDEFKENYLNIIKNALKRKGKKLKEKQ